jgi:hypothetical protein
MLMKQTFAAAAGVAFAAGLAHAQIGDKAVDRGVLNGLSSLCAAT